MDYTGAERFKMIPSKDRPRIITNSSSLSDLVQASSNDPITVAPLDVSVPLSEFGRIANEKGSHIVVLDYAALPESYQNEAGTSAILRAIHRANGMKVILVNPPDEEVVNRFVEAQSISGYVPPGAVTPTLLKSTILLAYENFKYDRDPLTKLYVRRFFNERIEDALSEVKKDSGTSVLSITMFDIDYFKKINDTHGHVVGDSALKQFGRILKSCYHRPDDIAARWGGEEFVVLCRDTELGDAYNLAEKVRLDTQQLSLNLSDGQLLNFNVSGGVTSYDGIDKNITSVDLVGKADKLLYKAKEDGRNRICK